MNTAPQSEIEIASEIRNRLEEILKSVSWIRSWRPLEGQPNVQYGFDFAIELESPEGLAAELWVECKSQARPASFPFQELKRELGREPGPRHRIPVLAAPIVSPRMAEICRQHGWSWVDLAGNCLLDVPGGVWIERTGLRTKRVLPKPDANLGTVESARILRTLLADRNLQRTWTQRDLRHACSPEVSLGLVNKVIRHLRDQKYLADGEDGKGFRLVDPAGLLREWRDAYRFDKHARFDLFAFLKPDKLRSLVESMNSEQRGRCALAAFSAAERISPHIRGESKTWLYVSRELEAAFRERAETKRVDTGANLVLLVPEDPGVFVDLQELPPATSAVQTYLDLMHCGSRGEEAAEAILAKHLLPRWEAAGFSCR